MRVTCLSDDELCSLCWHCDSSFFIGLSHWVSGSSTFLSILSLQFQKIATKKMLICSEFKNFSVVLLFLFCLSTEEITGQNEQNKANKKGILQAINS